MKNFRELKMNEEKIKAQNEQNMVKKLLEDQYRDEIKNLHDKLEKEREDRADLESKTMMAEKDDTSDQNK